MVTFTHLRRALLLRFFHLLYHQLAWAYDAISAAVSLGRWQAWGTAALPFAPGARVLELGHGPGHLLERLAAEGRTATGLDLSPQMGRLAARRLGRLGFPAQLVRGRGQALPFAGAAFDAVIAAFPAPYVLEPATLAAIRRVIRPGGRLVIVPQAGLIGDGILARAIEGLYAITGQRDSADAGANETRAYWTERLAAAGFYAEVWDVEDGDSAVMVVVAARPNDS